MLTPATSISERVLLEMLLHIRKRSLTSPSSNHPFLNEALEALERDLIDEALRVHGTHGRAAAALGLNSKQALQKRIARLRK